LLGALGNPASNAVSAKFISSKFLSKYVLDAATNPKDLCPK